jgi:hypothetical protein
MLVVLTIAFFATALGAQRAYIDGPAQFYWTGVLQGWAGVAIAAWLCWTVARSSAGGRGVADEVIVPMDAGTLMTVLTAASLIVGVAFSGLNLLVQRVVGPIDEWPAALSWGACGCSRWAGWALRTCDCFGATRARTQCGRSAC